MKGQDRARTAAGWRPSWLSWVALGLAVLGVVLASMPIAPIFALPPAFVAFVLAVIALAKRLGPKWVSVGALAVSLAPGAYTVYMVIGLALSMSQG